MLKYRCDREHAKDARSNHLIAQATEMKTLELL
jgi:hypothetical protein